MSNLPIYGSQSTGFGTKAGDQQYVKGIFNVFVSIGASNIATSSRSIDFLHLLIMSPSLTMKFVSRRGFQRQISLPLPRHPLNHGVRDVIPKLRIASDVFQISKRMRESSRIAPRHSEHEMHGNA